MSSQAPPNVIDTTLQEATKKYQKRQISDMNWGQPIKTFYKSIENWILLILLKIHIK